MSDTSDTIAGASPQSDDIPADDISVADQPGSDVAPPFRERRLHLRAFDYWDGLRGDREFPRFEDLKPDDLEEFRANCLLLDVSQDRGGIIRYVGSRIDELIDAPVMVGASLAQFPHATFAVALVDQLGDEQEHYRAVEFEFIEDVTDSRGILLPFTRGEEDGQDNVHFVMVVANFRTRIPEVIMPLDDEIMAAAPDPVRAIAPTPDSDFEKNLTQTQIIASEVVHPTGGTREGLYRALESAYQLYFDAMGDAETYGQILESQRLKVQKRAPFTPLLKLVFGKNYDKTRLTEYATALAYADRSGVAPTDLAAFLIEEPGGIKGCVRRERRARRNQSGTPAYDRQELAAKAVRQQNPAAKLDGGMVEDDKEFALLLVRKNEAGELDILGHADVSQETLDAAVRRQAAKLKDIDG